MINQRLQRIKPMLIYTINSRDRPIFEKNSYSKLFSGEEQDSPLQLKTLKCDQ